MENLKSFSIDLDGNYEVQAFLDSKYRYVYDMNNTRVYETSDFFRQSVSRLGTVIDSYYYDNNLSWCVTVKNSDGETRYFVKLFCDLNSYLHECDMTNATNRGLKYIRTSNRELIPRVVDRYVSLNEFVIIYEFHGNPMVGCNDGFAVDMIDRVIKQFHDIGLVFTKAIVDDFALGLDGAMKLINPTVLRYETD